VGWAGADLVNDDGQLVGATRNLLLIVQATETKAIDGEIGRIRRAYFSGIHASDEQQAIGPPALVGYAPHR
jgi:hypothetical protein